MSLESATYINGLVVTNPVGASDPKSKGDDHIRLIKSVIKNTFPNITGQVTATHGELNRLTGGTGAPTVFPTGTKMIFFQASAPTGWVQDSSITDTKMLRVVAYGSEGGGTLGYDDCHLMNVVPSHTHAFVSGESGGHGHRVYGSFSDTEDPGMGIAFSGVTAVAGIITPDTAYYNTLAGNGAVIIEVAPNHHHDGTTDGNSGADNWQPRIADVIVAVKS